MMQGVTARHPTHRLVQYLGHVINQELKVLRPMQSTEEVTERVLRRHTVRGLGHRIQYQNQKKLETVCDKELFRILEDNVVVRDPPAVRIVL